MAILIKLFKDTSRHTEETCKGDMIILHKGNSLRTINLFETFF